MTQLAPHDGVVKGRTGTRGPIRLRLLLPLVGIGLLTGAIGDDAARLAERRRQIEAMSQSEINHLKRNYERFQAMSPRERADVFRLHEQVEADGTGRLRKLLHEYNVWFSSLSPFDRSDLLGKSDPVLRAIRVQDLRKEQKQVRIARRRAEEYPILMARANSVSDKRGVLDPDKLDAVVVAIAEKALKPDYQKQVNKTLAGRQRHLQILSLVKDQVQQERQDRKGEAAASLRLVVSTTLALLPPELKERMARLGMQRELNQVGQLLGRSLLVEWRPEIDEVPPTQQQIDELIKRIITNAQPDAKPELESKFKTEDGRRVAATQVALIQNPKLDEIRPIVNWLVRGFGIQFDARGGGGMMRRPNDRPRPSSRRALKPAPSKADDRS